MSILFVLSDNHELIYSFEIVSIILMAVVFCCCCHLLVFFGIEKVIKTTVIIETLKVTSQYYELLKNNELENLD